MVAATCAMADWASIRVTLKKKERGMNYYFLCVVNVMVVNFCPTRENHEFLKHLVRCSNKSMDLTSDLEFW